MIALTQVIKEEEGLVLDDWTTYGAAKFVDLLHSFGEGSQIGYAPRDRIGTIALEHRMIRVER